MGAYGRRMGMPATAFVLAIVCSASASAQYERRSYYADPPVRYASPSEMPQSYGEQPRRRLPQTLFEAIQQARGEPASERNYEQARPARGERASPESRSERSLRAERRAERRAAERARRERPAAPAVTASVQPQPQAATESSGASFLSLFAPPTPRPVERLPVAADPLRPPALSLTVNPRQNPPEGGLAPRASFSGGNRVAYCVRLCDGRYFPLSNAADAGEEGALCNALCPGTPTKVFVSSDGSGAIDGAVEGEGRRRAAYSSLATAFAYREKTVPACGCHARGYGMTPVGLANDPTLRPGDIVATDKGLKTFRGARFRPYRAGDFIDVARYENFSPALRRQLSVLKVSKDATPVPLF